MREVSAVSTRLKAAGLPADFRDIIGRRVLLASLPQKVAADFTGVLKTYMAICRINGVKILRDGSIDLLFEKDPASFSPYSALLPEGLPDWPHWIILVTDCEYCDDNRDDRHNHCWDMLEVTIRLFD